jgi:acetolactate synthase-1/2/3 large subunit
VPEFIRRAFTYLRTGRPGPVLLTIPGDVCALEYDEDDYPYSPVKGWKSVPDPDDVKAAIQALLTAENPLLFAGEGVFYGDATDELRQLAELAQVPVMTSLRGKSAFPENHALSVGVRGELATYWLQKCDLVFAIGSDLHTGAFSQTIPDANSKTIIQCTVDELDLNLEYQVNHALVGNAKLTLQGLIDELSKQTGGGVSNNEELLDEIRSAKEQFLAKYRPLMTSNDVPINPYRVYGDLMNTIDLDNSFVTGDSGNTRDQTSTVYEARIPRGYLGWGKVTSLGFGLAAGMAAKLAFPERQCVNITGDAGVGYMLGNLETLVRNEIGVTTIHINNGRFGGYGPGFWGEGHSPYTSAVSDHSVADMSKTVEGMGYYAENISKPSEIVPALKRAFDENTRNRPAYLEVLCSEFPVYGQWAR